MSAIETRINDAAVRLFAERGSTELTMSELADEAQIARGTLYRNVESMEQLFARVIEDVVTEMHQKVARTLDASGDVDPALRLATGLRVFVRLAHDNPARGRFIVRFGMTEQSLRGILTGPPMQDVDAGVAEGRYAVDVGMRTSIASMMIGVTVSAMWMVLEGHQGWREAGTAAAELLLRSLGVAPAEAHKVASTPLPVVPSD